MGQAQTLQKQPLQTELERAFRVSRAEALLAVEKLPQREKFELYLDSGMNCLVYAAKHEWDDVVEALLVKRWYYPAVLCSVNCSAKLREPVLVALLRAAGDCAWFSNANYRGVMEMAMKENWVDGIDAILTYAPREPWLLLFLAIETDRPAVARRVIEAYGAPAETSLLAAKCAKDRRLYAVVQGSEMTVLALACAKGPSMNEVACDLVRSGNANVGWNDFAALRHARTTCMSEEVIGLLEGVRKAGYYQDHRPYTHEENRTNKN
jgi:hypothetical protein